MRNINIIMHYPEDEASLCYITNATIETYLLAVKKILDQSNLTLKEKKDLLKRVTIKKC